jgi:hypothetical protein
MWAWAQEEGLDSPPIKTNQPVMYRVDSLLEYVAMQFDR